MCGAVVISGTCRSGIVGADLGAVGKRMQDVLMAGGGIETMLLLIEALPILAVLTVGHLEAALFLPTLTRLCIVHDRDPATSTGGATFSNLKR